NLDVLARPVTYLTWDVRATDGQAHTVTVYYDNTEEPAVNKPGPPVVWSRGQAGSLVTLRVGTEEQPVLQKKGDDLRIDWGYLYVARPRSGAGQEAIVGDHAARDQFAKDGTLPISDDTHQPRPASQDWPVLATTVDFGTVGRT